MIPGGHMIVVGGGAVTAEAVGDAWGEWLGEGTNLADVRTTLGVEGDPGFPTDGLVVAWEATSLDLDDGDFLDEWVDDVRGAVVSTPGGSRPVFRSNIVPVGSAGGPGVEFNNSPLIWVAPTGLPTGASPSTIVVFAYNCLPTGETYSHLFHYGSVGVRRARGLAYDDQWWKTHEWGSSISSQSYGRDGGPRAIGQQYDGTAVTLFVNGGKQRSAAATLNTGQTSLAIGGRFDGAEMCKAVIMAVAVWDRVLTPAENAQVAMHGRLAYGVR